MTDKIGVLGQANAVAIGATTVYTVPSGKAARIRLFYLGASGANSALRVSVNGIVIFITPATAAGTWMASMASAMSVIGGPAIFDGTADAKTTAPGPREYYLSAGQNVTYEVLTAALQTMNFQVVGAEVDV